jgi:hypothetical protein
MSRNRFGLPAPSPSPESQEARAKRRSEVTAFLEEAFAAAVDQLGLDDARQVWNQISSDKKRARGRPPKRELSGYETLILLIWEEMKDDPSPETLIRHLARFFHEHYPKQYKHIDRKSLERRIRTLLKDLKEGRLVREGDEFKMVPHSREN